MKPIILERVWEVTPLGKRPEKNVAAISHRAYKNVKIATSELRSSEDRYGRRKSHYCYPNTYIYFEGEFGDDRSKRIVMRSTCEIYLDGWSDMLGLPLPKKLLL